MDTLLPEQRSRLMASIRGKDTKPEMTVRKLVHALGYRYRLHGRELPGSPDLVFASRRKVIFVNGCFWHRHEGCRFSYTPKSNSEFWLAKFSANVQRDRRALEDLETLGWKALVIWECEVRGLDALSLCVTNFLESEVEVEEIGDVER